MRFVRSLFQNWNSKYRPTTKTSAAPLVKTAFVCGEKCLCNLGLNALTATAEFAGDSV
jgi:hypothetical protein